MHRTNNFDLMRVIFASIVGLYHCAVLSQQPTLSFIPHIMSFRVAIEGFFAMSGYLVVGSYERSASLPVYLEKRARIILPAYWGALILGLILGTIETNLSIPSFWRSHDTWKFIFANLSLMNFLHPSLPGVFSLNPGEAAVNGALWTIKIEVMFYLLVPSLVLVSRKLGKFKVFGLIFVLSSIYYTVCERYNHDTIAKQLPGQLCFFAVGSLVYYYSSWLLEHRVWMWTVAIGLYLSYLAIGGIALRALGVSSLVLCFALLFPHIDRPTRYGDFSYGIYVFHFPIIQTLIAVGLFAVHPGLAVGATCCAVAILAVGSWNFIEKPSLNQGQKKQSFKVVAP